MPGLFGNRRWDVLPNDGRTERMLCERLGISPLVARVLSARGIRSEKDAREFLHPSLKRDWADPLEIPGMEEAADRVERALAEGQRIAVFGDFDVDGMTSTCLLTQALRLFGGHADPYIPHRFGEGYGLSHEALVRVIEGSRPDLIITVDNGIAAATEVAWLLEQGVDVVITDHHEPGDLVPQGVPVTDPKLSSTCTSRELSGAGVALKLVCELGRRLGKPDLWWEFTDLAAMGTVSDMMTLQGENRSLVADGIGRMRRSTRAGIVALAATAGVELSDITADNLPFSLVPRLNAAGRMGTTEVAFDLLICDDIADATVLAGMLEQTNNERRETEAHLSEQALALIEDSYDGGRAIVIAGEGWHEGVKGIVASRIVSRFHVPAIVFSVNDGLARGSGRSVGTVDLFHAVEQCSDVLVRFGGHAGAVGVTCEVDHVDAFRTKLEHVLESLPPEQFEDRGEVTSIAGLGDFSQQNIDALEVLQPFGQGNKRPLFGVRGVFMRNRARVGYEGNHLRFVATDGKSSIPAIMFRTPEIDRAYACDGLVDIVADAVNETWQGRTHPKLMVRDILYRDEAECEKGGIADELFNTGPQHASECVDEKDVNAKRRSQLACLSVPELTERLRTFMIGEHDLLPAQREALANLAAGRSTLCVMATGRGKSLIFHLHAARVALREGKASVFVYPLRALVSDQAFHLVEKFSEFGLGVRVLTGETSEEERVRIYAEVAEGTADVVLTTPEYLALHVNDLASSGRVGFVVIDEAHHAGVARGGNRGAYTRMPEVLQSLGSPAVLAVTATASAPVAREICRLLSIDEEDVVIDRSLRRNLHVVDHRDLRDRDTLLSSLVSTGDKTVVYVNSRLSAEGVARNLRVAVPELGHRIAFYHAGLSRELRLRVEEAFRDGRLCCIVSTSAFGEGVNLPDIRNVVLYHMPFGTTEFNQMSGRAGRDGRDARVHLLYGSRDAHINEQILSAEAPARDDLAVIYRALMTEARRMPDDTIALSDSEILARAQLIDERSRLCEAHVRTGLAVFGELGFLRVEGFEDRRRIRMVEAPAHMDLTDSIRYVEGQHSLREFLSFRDWALSSLPQEMLSRINRPITPGFGHTVDR